MAEISAQPQVMCGHLIMGSQYRLWRFSTSYHIDHHLDQQTISAGKEHQVFGSLHPEPVTTAMKIIEYRSTAQNVTHLPAEVLDIIIQHIQLHRSRRVAQRDLWSCCLISQEWYAVTIKHLYEAPLLLPRNFPEFARTLSPALSSRVRQIGLEKFVEHLDMGIIAYESQKSTTSRLLSRTKTSLRSFVAPAVSFSTTSLAPLSKCLKLQQLDLSRDQYDFGLGRLLGSIKDLSHLEWLSLPKDCPSVKEHVAMSNTLYWPLNLTFLQFNTSKTAALSLSNFNIVAHLPPKLSFLTFNHCTSYEFLESFESSPASRITKLCVRVNRCDGFFNFNTIVKPFPQIVKLTIPAMTQWLFKDFVYSANDTSWSLTATAKDPVVAENLESLILEESPDFPFSDHIGLGELKQFIENCPRLLRIEVPVAYLNVDDFVGDGTNEMNSTLLRRAKEATERPKSGLTIDEVGLYMTEPKENAGVGLKRSFRYPAND